MNWLSWTLVSLLLSGTWGVVAKRILRQLDWRVLASLAILGYIAPVTLIWLCAPPSTSQLTWPLAGKAVSVGLLTQIAMFMYYRALESGGKAAVVASITALYPAITLGGALLLLDESLSVTQCVGAALALAAATLLARG